MVSSPKVKSILQLCGHGHARQQINGAGFQSPGTLGIRARKILNGPTLFAGDVGENVNGNAFDLAVRIGKDQRCVIMKADGDPLVSGRCVNCRKQAKDDE
jgi:hypothetical protein